jgi:magnesium-transporting ATPase (P-type)
VPLQISGDPTDVAPLVLFTKLGGDHNAAQAAATKLKVIPFESLHKWQGSLVRDESVPGGRVAHFKGAPERLFAFCSGAVAGEDPLAPPVPFNSEWWQAKAAALSSRGLRVLAVARWAPPADFDETNLSVAWVTEQPPFLTLVCLIAILDPPRAECVVAIREFHAAGITVKVHGSTCCVEISVDSQR